VLADHVVAARRTVRLRLGAFEHSGLWDHGAVAGDQRWERHREAAAAEVRAGETVLWILPALSPQERDGGLAITVLILPLMALRRWMWHRSTRAAAKQSLFPLAPRMILALTDRRLLIWSARRRFRLGEFIGFVTLDRVVMAEVLTVGAGWRSLRIDLANEPSVRLKVPGSLADELAAVLSGQPLGTGAE
jgi:hypothetical protein